MINIDIKEKKFKNNILFKDTAITLNNNGKLTVLLGESGIGKTTLCNMIKGLDLNYKGSILIRNKEVSSINENVCLVLQDNNLFENLTVLENLMIFSDETDVITKYLNDFGLLELKNSKAITLSGGQRQRLSIIRGLLQNCSIFILDEPTSGLDNDNFNLFISKMNEIKKECQIIIVTHDIRFNDLDVNEISINDKKLILKQQTSCSVKDKPRDILKIKLKFSNIVKFYKNFLNLNIFKVLITSLLAFLFLLITTNLFYEVDKSFEELNSYQADDIIVVNSDDLKERSIYTDEFGNTYDFGFSSEQMYWNQDDTKFLDSLGVKYSFLNLYSEGYFDLDGDTFKQSYPISDFNYLLGTKSIEFGPENIDLEFINLDIPSDFSDKYTSGNTSQLEIIEGSYPKDSTYEILIPDFVYYSLNELEDFSLNDTLQLDVSDLFGNIINKEYKIVGYYKTNATILVDDSYPIYIPYQQEDFSAYSDANQEFILSNYEMELATKSSEQVYYNYISGALENFETYKDFWGYGFSTIVIETTNSTSEQIINYFDDYNIITSKNYLEEYHDTMDYILGIKLGYVVIFGLIFNGILIMVFKMYYAKSAKNMGILLINSYSKSQILLSYLVIYIFEIIIISLLMLFSIIISAKTYLPIFIIMYEQMANLTFLFILMCYLISYVLISILFNYFNLKSRMIIKNLR